MVAISSTMIVARVFAELKVPKALSEVVFGVLVIQDVAAVLLLAVLAALARPGGLGGEVLASTASRLSLFLVVIVTVGVAAIIALVG